MIGNILGGAMGKLAIQGDFESIATVTVTGATQASIDFTNIPSTYQHLQIRASAFGSATSWVRMQFNNDTATNYNIHELRGNGASASASASTSTDHIWTGLTESSTHIVAQIVDILDYDDTNKFKTVRTLWGQDRNGAGSVGLSSGAWRSTSAITSIKLYINGGNFTTNTHFALYGIKG